MRRIVTDIIIQNTQELAGGDVRINFDPSQIQSVSATTTPFTAASDFVTGWTGQTVSLINLPAPPYTATFSGIHRTASPAFNDDNTNGAVFLAGTYLGERLFKVSSEAGPSVDSATNTLPDRNAGQAPNGGVFARISWNLQAASDGQDVLIDLTTQGPSFSGGGSITAGSAFATLTGEDPGFTQEIITLGNSDLFDDVVSVNKAIPDPCPPVAGTPTATARPTPTPVSDGDLNCDAVVNVVDALFILQGEVGLRDPVSGCPPPPPPPDTFNVDACDVSSDGLCNVVDALFVLQREVGIPNTFCPATIEAAPEGSPAGPDRRKVAARHASRGSRMN